MARLTVRLPSTLHKQLTTLAKAEGVSLNQYIVYALARHTATAWTTEAMPALYVAESLRLPGGRPGAQIDANG